MYSGGRLRLKALRTRANFFPSVQAARELRPRFPKPAYVGFPAARQPVSERGFFRFLQGLNQRVLRCHEIVLPFLPIGRGCFVGDMGQLGLTAFNDGRSFATKFQTD